MMMIRSLQPSSLLHQTPIEMMFEIFSRLKSAGQDEARFRPQALGMLAHLQYEGRVRWLLHRSDISLFTCA
jgi:hypothetical protein